jgi:hypothetical protein
MSSAKYSFRITTCINCPLYKKGDRFALSELALSLPLPKPTCLVLARDMAGLLLYLKGCGPHEPAPALFSCSGCQGLIKFERSATEVKEEDQAQLCTVGFSGHLEEFPPEELFQAINMNQKTGTLVLDLNDGIGTAAFKNGQIMSASLKGYEDSEAFFMLLREKGGEFHFSRLLPPSLEDAKPLGDFMNLFMEGLQKIDEETP